MLSSRAVDRDRHDAPRCPSAARAAVDSSAIDQSDRDRLVAQHRLERVDRDRVVGVERVRDDVDRAAAREPGRVGVGVGEAERAVRPAPVESACMREHARHPSRRTRPEIDPMTSPPR